MLDHILYDDHTKNLIDRGFDALMLSTQEMAEAWGFGNSQRWDADLDVGTIRFTSPGIVAIAPVQVIGTHVLADHSWRWAWANPSVEEHLTRASRLVRHYGRERGIGRFEEPQILCTTEDAWALTALAAQLSEAHCAYRGPENECFVFMTFGKPTIFRS